MKSKAALETNISSCLNAFVMSSKITIKNTKKALRAFVDKTKLIGGFSSSEWKARQTHVPIIQSAFENTHAHTHTHTRIDVFFHAFVKVRFTRLFLQQQQEQQQQTTLRPRKEEKRIVISIVLEDYRRGVQRYWHHQQQQQQEKQQKVRSNGGR
jgi:hypothetical protein